MPTLLRIDSSSRLADSISRGFADEVEARWLARHPDGEVIGRDLVVAPIPHIADATIRGFYAASLDAELTAATALSDELIGEFLGADAVLLSLPMYNFSIPSALKAYIDHIVRANRTFGVREGGQLVGLVEDRPLYLVVAKGAPYTGTDFEAMDFTERYLLGLFSFLGVSSTQVFRIEGTTIAPEVMASSLASARAELVEIT